jgi:hypothetical protein
MKILQQSRATIVAPGYMCLAGRLSPAWEVRHGGTRREPIDVT